MTSVVRALFHWLGGSRPEGKEGASALQPLGRIRQKIAVLLDRAALHRYAVPDAGDRAIEPRRAVHDEELGPPQAAPD